MKRLVRVFADALTVLSLVLCVEAAVFSVRSYWVIDRLRWTTATEDTILLIERGRIVLIRTGLVDDERRGSFSSTTGFSHDEALLWPESIASWRVTRDAWRFAGGIYQPEMLIDSDVGRLGYGLSSIPLWWPSALLASVPFVRWRRRQRRLRRGRSDPASQ